MAIISSFELLIKPQLPKAAPVGPAIPPQASKLSRNVVLGYFLTLSNLDDLDFECQLLFTVRLPNGRTLDELIGIVDTSGSDELFNLTAIDTNQFGATITLPSKSTTLVILQPDFVEFPNLLTSLDFEVRGFVEIRRTAASLALPPIRIVATPEHRGTFFSNLNGNIPDEIGLDQIAYSLPVRNGGVLEI
jgi:hypothetical protein